MPPRKRPQAFTLDSPLPAAAAAKKPRNSSAKTPRKNKELKEAELAQETHLSVNAFYTLEYIGCESSVPILCNSIDIDDYNQRLFYFWSHICIIVRNTKLKEQDAIFNITVPEFAVDYEQQGQLLDIFENVYLLFQKQLIEKICYYGRMWIN
jgi:hypothetical protein